MSHKIILRDLTIAHKLANGPLISRAVKINVEARCIIFISSPYAKVDDEQFRDRLSILTRPSTHAETPCPLRHIECETVIFLKSRMKKSFQPASAVDETQS
ncbi:hypothetical protein CERSUDRAFT_82486 [Gelatoporia subvermispora B]|uniref:Uncharacterized protein n=1 Tax=Ceriporiopsis subvermispora (strain B) TaxID=914234 RepID=M2PP43_CERS8|nr:hypothetical protein CERSUDRAFT_82486 [Gelatoporia subvermispora B]